MICIECKKDTVLNKGTVENPLCPECYTKIARAAGYDPKEEQKLPENSFSRELKVFFLGPYLITKLFKNRISAGTGVAILFLIILFCGFIHIIPEALGAGHSPIEFKDGFSLRLTFVDVQKVIEESNQRSIIEKIRGDRILDHLLNILIKDDLAKHTSNITNNQESNSDGSSPLSSSENSTEDRKDTSQAAVTAQIKIHCKNKWPNDYSMQRYEYKIQFEGYVFMKNSKDMEVKIIAEQRWPDDYSMQEYEYNRQVLAKQELQ